MLKVGIVRDKTPFDNFVFNEFDVKDLEELKEIFEFASVKDVEELYARLSIANKFLFIKDTDTKETIAIGGYSLKQTSRPNLVYVSLFYNCTHSPKKYSVPLFRFYKKYLNGLAKKYDFIFSLSLDNAYLERHHSLLGFRQMRAEEEAMIKEFITAEESDKLISKRKFWIYEQKRKDYE
jgi:hypothetical protein